MKPVGFDEKLWRFVYYAAGVSLNSEAKQRLGDAIVTQRSSGLID